MTRIIKNKKIEKPFPKLMYSTSSECYVFFEKPNHGQCIVGDCNPGGYVVGDILAGTVCMDNFIDVNNTTILFE